VLPEPHRSGEVSLESVLARRRSVREYAAAPVPIAAVAQLLWAAQGITDAEGLRTAPSAGALHPLETYLVAGAVVDLAPGVYDYDPRPHRLQPRAPGDLRRALGDAAFEQDWLAEAPAVIALGAVPERSQCKYGRRALRYVHMEAGHAAQNVCLQAVALSLASVVVGAFRDRAVHELLGLPPEVQPLLLLPVGVPVRPHATSARTT
jgi:SagB-type dehydrogenase family enzyme